VRTIDKLTLDTGEVHLHPTAFLYTKASDGTDQAQTTRSGIVVDMDMCGLAYTPDAAGGEDSVSGGGQKAIVDAIF